MGKEGNKFILTVGTVLKIYLSVLRDRFNNLGLRLLERMMIHCFKSKLNSDLLIKLYRNITTEGHK